jgi:putative glycosyltransferase (TIGR04372 family)
MSSLVRKKLVYVNFIPLNLSQLSWCSPGSLILPKKIFNKQKGRFLTFKENTEIEFDIHTEIDPYKKNDLSVINNSPKEILDGIIEMEEKLLGNISDDSIRLNNLFWKSITDNNHEKINYLKNNLKLFISTQFLKDNQNLYD